MVVDPATDDRFPPLDPGDLYVYFHPEGVISVADAQGRVMQQSLGPLVDRVLAAQAADHSVWLSGPDSGPGLDALHVLLDASTTPFELWPTPAPPVSWAGGGDGVLAAAEFGQVEILDDLIARNVPLDRTDDNGNSPLHKAVFGENLAGVRSLLDAGADPAVTNRFGFTPAMVALSLGHRDILRALVTGGGAIVDDPVDFGFDHRLYKVLNLPTAIGCLALVALMVVGGLPIVAAAVIVAVIAGGFAWFYRRHPTARRGALVRLEGSRVRVQHGFSRHRWIDLATVSAMAMAGPQQPREWIAGRGYLAFGHPDGLPWTHAETRWFHTSEAEAAVIESWPGPVLCLEYDRTRRDRAVPAVLTAAMLAGVEFSEGVKAELNSSLNLRGTLTTQNRLHEGTDLSSRVRRFFRRVRP